MKPFLLLIFLIVFQIVFGQSIEEKLQKHQAAYPIEKIYVSHNQPHYASGDTLYGNIFLVNGRSHQFFEGSPIVYVDWLNEAGVSLVSYTVKIKEGTANLSIPLKRAYGEGRFFLRAYTQYQKNFDDHFIFQKEIKVMGETPLTTTTEEANKIDIDVQFFPEGGRLVAGLNSVIAYKAIDRNGHPVDIEGVILDKTQQEITSFKSVKDGIGIFYLQPEWQQQYQAKVSWNGQTSFFDLPSMLKEGYLLKVSNRKADQINLQLITNTKNGLKECKLIGHIRGQPFLNQAFSEEYTQKLVLNRAELPSGILHFTLFDEKERPVCERLVYNHNSKELLSLTINLPQLNYTHKALVTGSISIKELEKNAAGKLSMTVYNKELFPKSSAGINIQNYLLLQSDLKGHISNINQYFEKEDVKSRTLLDYVMLTHGWRRFNWQEVLLEKTTPIVYPTQESISFAGKVTKDNKAATPLKADVFLNILDGANFSAVNMTTDLDGLFYFKGFDLPDSTKILFQGNVHNTKKKRKLKAGEAKRMGNKNVKIELLDLHKLSFNEKISLKPPTNSEIAKIEFAEEIKKMRKIDTINHPEWSINLDAVTVKAQKIDAKRKRGIATKKLFKERGYFYSDLSQKVYMEDVTAGGAIYTDIYGLIRDRVMNAQIRTVDNGRGPEKVVILRGESSFNLPTAAIFEVDGAIVSSSTVSSLVPSEIAMIDVKKGLAATSIYGGDANGGVITIITKDPTVNHQNIKAPGTLTILHPGYHQARTFYQPNYTEDSTERTKTDYRTTLYWNPNLKIAKKPTTFSFYTGDKAADFLIMVEGITKEGIPFVGHTTFKVRKNVY